MGEKDTRVPMDGEIYRGIDIKLDYTDYNKSDKKLGWGMFSA